MILWAREDYRLPCGIPRKWRIAVRIAQTGSGNFRRGASRGHAPRSQLGGEQRRPPHAFRAGRAIGVPDEGVGRGQLVEKRTYRVVDREPSFSPQGGLADGPLRLPVLA